MENGYIRDGGRGEGGGASLLSSGGWEDHVGDIRDRNYDNSGIIVRRKRLFRGDMKEGGGRGYNNSSTSFRYLANTVVFSNW